MHSACRLLAATALLLPLAGCTVQTHNGANGNDVKIDTPLGGLAVKTDPASVQSKVGLALYPGAALEAKKGDNDSSADVNMNFGAFRLRVLAMSFTTPDSSDKVRAFYRTALAQYSDVIECRDKKPVGTTVKTGLGLTCADDNHVHSGTATATINNVKYETELKSGSPSRQHIVTLEPAGSGTKFGLVALELPHSDDNGAN